MKKVLIILLIALFAMTNMVLAADVIVEGEDYIKEEGGSGQKVGGRVGATGLMVTSWDNPGHAFEWEVDIPEDGSYKLVIRVCNGRDWTTYREILIDGQHPSDAFKKVAIMPTGGFAKTSNDFINLTVSDAQGQPALVQLTKGKHIVRMVNLGGESGNGGTGIDRFGFLGKDVDPSVLGKSNF